MSNHPYLNPKNLFHYRRDQMRHYALSWKTIRQIDSSGAAEILLKHALWMRDMSHERFSAHPVLVLHPCPFCLNQPKCIVDATAGRHWLFQCCKNVIGFGSTLKEALRSWELSVADVVAKN